MINAANRKRAAKPSVSPIIPALLHHSEDGTFLDHRIGLRGASVEAFRDFICGELVERQNRKRQRSAKQLANHQTRIVCLIANALRAALFRASPRVAFVLMPQKYKGTPEWFSPEGIRADIDAMASCGLIEYQLGEPGPFSYSEANGRASTFWSTERLLDLAKSHGLGSWSIIKLPPQSDQLVELRGPKPDYGSAKVLTFDGNSETAAWADSLESWNHFASEFDVELDLSDDKLSSVATTISRNKSANDRQPGLKTPELFHRSLRRIFNDGTFSHGGRLYGGWWQLLPEWSRRRILIDDEPTVEIDYAGMAVRILYHQKGIDYLEDPYKIPELIEYAKSLGKSPKYFRKSNKQLLSAMLNGDGLIRPEQTRELELSYRPRYSRRQVREMIETLHVPIVDQFYTGVGKRIQRLDSDIALQVISDLQAEEILALPIHDSFIVQMRHYYRLKEVMSSVYHQRLGFLPQLSDNKKVGLSIN